MKLYYKFLFIFSILFFLTHIVGQDIYAQKKSSKSDSTEVKVHSPKKATYLALIPGAGQIYNKKYWKVPIVYAGFGVMGYFAIANRKEYLIYNEAYTCSVLEGDDCTNDLTDRYSSDELKSIKDYYQRNMELSFIIMGAWYVLQILDASVDAHLYYWEVNEDLSVDIQPVVQPIIPRLKQPGQEIPYNGIKVRFKF